MDKVKHFFELKEQWKAASEEEKGRIDGEIAALLDSLDNDEQKQLAAVVSDDLQNIHQGVEALNRTFSVRKMMASVLPFISVSALAKTYFGKSASWFYQRLNGNVVHGKPVSFTEEELAKLSRALNDVAAQLQRAAAAVAY